MNDAKLAKQGIPRQTMIRLPEVMETTKMGKTLIYALIKKGEFPKPAKFGRISVWSEDEVNAWVNSRLLARAA